jgi:predicted amidophosphoribosyltransferase
MYDCICCLCQNHFKSENRLDSVCPECRYANNKCKDWELFKTKFNDKFSNENKEDYIAPITRHKVLTFILKGNKF